MKKLPLLLLPLLLVGCGEEKPTSKAKDESEAHASEVSSSITRGGRSVPDSGFQALSSHMDAEKLRLDLEQEVHPGKIASLTMKLEKAEGAAKEKADNFNKDLADLRVAIEKARRLGPEYSERAERASVLASDATACFEAGKSEVRAYIFAWRFNKLEDAGHAHERYIANLKELTALKLSPAKAD